MNNRRPYGRALGHNQFVLAARLAVSWPARIGSWGSPDGHQLGAPIYREGQVCCGSGRLLFRVTKAAPTTVSMEDAVRSDGSRRRIDSWDKPAPSNVEQVNSVLLDGARSPRGHQRPLSRCDLLLRFRRARGGAQKGVNLHPYRRTLETGPQTAISCFSQMCQGARLARRNRRFACSYSGNTSRTGSHFRERPSL